MILDRLRDATRDLHERVERRLPVLDPALTLGRYRDTLVALHAVYRPLERRLAAVPGLDAVHGLDLAARWKTPLLARDLRALGMPGTARATLPDADVPAIRDAPSALGALYVLEGATLGGQPITRHLVRTLPVTPAHGCAFFASYGGRVGAMWRAYREAAAAYVARHDGPDADDAVVRPMLDAARDTFAAFDRATAALR